jgi:hypothetical protein
MTLHSPTGTVPAIDSADNITVRDVIGNKQDTAAGDSLAAREVVPAADSADNDYASDVTGNKLDTFTADSIVGRIKKNLLYSEHIPLYGGEIWHVSPTGNDANTGETPHEAFLTIGHAITTAAAGDAIIVTAGTYAEAVDLSKDFMELWIELGVVIAPGAGTPLTISGNYCKVWSRGGSLFCTPVAAGTGVLVSGNNNYIHDVRINCASSANIGFDITGSGCVLSNCRCANPLTVSFRLQNDLTKLRDCLCGSTLGNTSIGFLITNSCDIVRLIDCGSGGNETAGYQIDAGVTNAILINCTSGAGDGHWIDNGAATFLDVSELDSKEHHEHVHPSPDGEGTAGNPIIVQSRINDETGATNVKDYFGDVAQIIAPSVITEGWYLKGINFFATTAADDQRFTFYRVVSSITASRNGGNAWDEGATVLTVTDAAEAAQFEVDDLVWIRTPGYQPDGEIVVVVSIVGAVITIARNVEQSARTGLHWDHTADDAGNEEMYLCHRDDNNQFHESQIDYSASSTRDFTNYLFEKSRRMGSNDGLICRMINGTDNLNSQCSVSAIWTD